MVLARQSALCTAFFMKTVHRAPITATAPRIQTEGLSGGGGVGGELARSCPHPLFRGLLTLGDGHGVCGPRRLGHQHPGSSPARPCREDRVRCVDHALVEPLASSCSLV